MSDLNLPDQLCGSFPLDEDAVPEACPANKVPYLNHGKCLARNRQGIWFGGFIFDRGFADRNWLALAISRKPDSGGSNFHPAILLLGHDDHWHHPVLECGPGFLLNCALLMDARDRLPVIYEQANGLYRMTGDASGFDAHDQLMRPAGWSAPERVAEAGSALGDAMILPSGDLWLCYTRDEVLYEKMVGGTEIPICPKAIHPTVWMDGSGARHIAFERDRRIFYIRSAPDGKWTDTRGNPAPEQVACFCSSWPSIAATPGGKVVIAYQGEGKVDLKRCPELYTKLRAAGGATVSYAVLSNGAWKIYDFLRSSEILLKRQPCSSLPTRDPVFVHFMEEFWRPSLAVDKHGVIWMFYLNTTRRHVFFTRFQGETFGDHFEARGAYDCLSRVLLVQKDARDQSAIGTLTLAHQQFYFDAIETPDYASNEPRRIVFLDNLEVDEMVGLEHRVGQWQKHPQPIFGAGISGNGGDDHIAWCEVRRTDGGFEMRYMGMEKLYSNCAPGRAFSTDGIHWEKRAPFDHLSMTLDGKPFPNHFWRPIYLEDQDEPDPARRFKGLLGNYRYERGVEFRVWDVVASPDGVDWRTAPGLPAVVTGDISVNCHLFRDDADQDPRRRYKVMMVMGACAGRAVAVFTSADLVHWQRVVHLRENPEQFNSALSPWTTGPIAIDPDAAESPWEEEVHGANAWRENGILMFHYDAFYFGSNQHTQNALAISRDGKHYWRIKRGAVNLPHGNCGEWDSGRDRSAPPVRVGDELWLYFAGMPAGNFANPDCDDPASVKATPPSPDDNRLHREQRPWKVGLAKLRVDGWGFVQRRREASRGYFTTIPFRYAGGELVVNGTGLSGASVEMRTADNRMPVKGFERGRFSGEDGIDARVTWEGDAVLPNGSYRLRFTIRSLEARLFAFGFLDKDGNSR